MSKRRMFSQSIVESDAFLDMPLSSQALYFHLAMNADDYGFVSPKRIMRMVGANDDDLKLLILKRFVLGFDSGVVVMKHWQINNTVRKDRSRPTTYDKEFKSLTFNEFGAYTERRKIITTIATVEEATTKLIETTGAADNMATEWQPNGNQKPPQTRLDKIRLDKNSNNNLVAVAPTARPDPVSKNEIDEIIAYWVERVGFELGNETGNRRAIAALIRQHGMDKLKRLVDGAALAMDDQYAPRISDFVSLKRKQNDLLVWGRKRNSSGKVDIIS
jgi:hypothetical protein